MKQSRLTADITSILEGQERMSDLLELELTDTYEPPCEC